MGRPLPYAAGCGGAAGCRTALGYPEGAACCAGACDQGEDGCTAWAGGDVGGHSAGAAGGAWGAGRAGAGFTGGRMGAAWGRACGAGATGAADQVGAAAAGACCGMVRGGPEVGSSEVSRMVRRERDTEVGSIVPGTTYGASPAP